MPPLRIALLVVLLDLFAGCWQHPCRGQLGGFDESNLVEVSDEVYEPIRLPVSAKAARAWIALHETMIRPLPDQTPFGAIINAVKAAVRGKNGKNAAFELYLDPLALRMEELTLETPMSSPFVGDQDVSVYQYIQLLLRASSLVCTVYDGIVIIDFECDDCPGEPKVTAPEAWTWLVLHEVVPLSFPKETPLQDVLKEIQRATLGKGKDGRGLAIYGDPLDLRDVKAKLSDKVSIELEHVPLRASLGLVLKQAGLGFRVAEDGILIITNSEEVDNPIDEAQLAWRYQLQRYAAFYDRQNSRMELRRLEAELLKRFRASARPGAGEPRGDSGERGVEPKSTEPEKPPKGPPSDEDRPESKPERDQQSR